MTILSRIFRRRAASYRQAPPLANPQYLAVHIAEVTVR
jgi:hypothetical protein